MLPRLGTRDLQAIGRVPRLRGRGLQTQELQNEAISGDRALDTRCQRGFAIGIEWKRKRTEIGEAEEQTSPIDARGRDEERAEATGNSLAHLDGDLERVGIAPGIQAGSVAKGTSAATPVSSEVGVVPLQKWVAQSGDHV